jgi:ribonuclease BN (tRNA processing enzyme)
MRVRLLASAMGGSADHHYLHTFLIDATVAIDAGALGAWGAPQDQARIDHVFLTHSHADHIATLPVFLENGHSDRDAPVVVRGPAHTLDALRSDLFNGRVWPDFVNLRAGGRGFVALSPLEPEVPVHVAGLRITAVPVNHPVPTYGYLVEDGRVAVAFGGDSGPTTRLWELACAAPGFAAAFLECSFPDRLAALAEQAGHLRPALFAAEVRKLPPTARAIAVHIKARHRAEVAAELRALDEPRIELGRCNHDYLF